MWLSGAYVWVYLALGLTAAGLLKPFEVEASPPEKSPLASASQVMDDQGFTPYMLLDSASPSWNRGPYISL